MLAARCLSISNGASQSAVNGCSHEADSLYSHSWHDSLLQEQLRKADMSTKIAQHAYEELRNRVGSEQVARSKGEARERGLARDARTGSRSPSSCKDDSAHEQCDAGATSADTASDFEEDSEVSVAFRPPLTEVI